jgi:N-acetylmuramoyl-L-alanine amidase
MRIVENFLPYIERLAKRDVSSIKLAVIHCTELPDLQMAREFGERIIYEQTGTGVSGHYYIDRNGDIHQYVPENRIANHVIGYNDRSIGIELVNRGRYPSWYSSTSQISTEPYPEVQIESLKTLLSDLKQRFINLQQIARHSDLDQGEIPASDNADVLIHRKIDPGPLFPWDELLLYWQTLQA